MFSLVHLFFWYGTLRQLQITLHCTYKLVHCLSSSKNYSSLQSGAVPIIETFYIATTAFRNGFPKYLTKLRSKEYNLSFIWHKCTLTEQRSIFFGGGGINGIFFLIAKDKKSFKYCRICIRIIDIMRALRDNDIN